MHLLCSNAVDVGVQSPTQSKTFKLVVSTQPQAPIQHRHVRAGERDPLAATLNGGQGTRRVNQTTLCLRQRNQERAWKGVSA